jgi:hypothetical protein
MKTIIFGKPDRVLLRFSGRRVKYETAPSYYQKDSAVDNRYAFNAPVFSFRFPQLYAILFSLLIPFRQFGVEFEWGLVILFHTYSRWRKH